MTNYFIRHGFVESVSNKDSQARTTGFDLLRWLRKSLNRLGVPFNDACCPNASTVVNRYAVIFPVGGESINAGGTISVANYYTSIVGGASINNYTLADGTVDRQLKKILLRTAGAAVAVVHANGGVLNITFAVVRDYVSLMWDASTQLWIPIETVGAVLS